MARRKRWTEKDTGDGISVYKLRHWKDYGTFLHEEGFLEYEGFVWRGQREEHWPLEPSLDRKIRRFKKRSERKNLRQWHLQAFKESVRGRRGDNPPPIATENDWWSLGQHHGLFTPLLDWTRSPYAAAYFAFCDSPYSTSRYVKNRAVYGLNQTSVEEMSRKIREGYDERMAAAAPTMEFIEPMSDYNARLVSQRGLFTRAPDGVNVERWVREHSGGANDYYVLVKILIPDEESYEFLRFLNRMNINHLSLFPDLEGASEFCNFGLEIDEY